MLYTRKNKHSQRKQSKIDEMENFLELKDAKQKNNAIRG